MSNLREVCQILRPFELITTEVSSEKSVTVSKVIVLVCVLMSASQKIKTTMKTAAAQQMISTIHEHLKCHFAKCEMNQTLACVTFRRFRIIGV